MMPELGKRRGFWRGRLLIFSSNPWCPCPQGYFTKFKTQHTCTPPPPPFPPLPLFLPSEGASLPLLEGNCLSDLSFILKSLFHQLLPMCRYSFFPQLRATADLLMMPKEVLTDRSIRAEILPGLSLRRICTLLERFQPDDFSADPLPRGQHPEHY